MKETMKKLLFCALLSGIFINTLYPDPLTTLGNTLDAVNNKVNYAVTRPSLDDHRVKALIYVGAVLVATGSVVTLLGSYRASQSAGQTDENHQPVGIVSDALARIGGLGTAILGLACTVGGGASIVLAQEAIFQLQKFLNQASVERAS